jgi:YidC/Oxa1 family membrane protein insertase
MTMERRAILAAVLMVGLLILYQALFMPSAPPEPPPVADRPAAPGTQPQPVAPGVPAPVAPAAPAVPLTPPRETAPAEPERTFTVDTPLYRAVIGSEGGRVREWTLKYRGEKPIVTGPVQSRGVVVGPPGEAPAAVPMRLPEREIVLGDGRPSAEVRMVGDSDGLHVAQTVRFSAMDYLVDLAVRVENRGSEPRSLAIALPWDAPQTWREHREEFPGQHPSEVVWSAGGQVHRVVSLCEAPTLATEGQWIGLGTTGYVAALMPQDGVFRLAASAEDRKVCEAAGKEPGGRATVALQATPQLAPGASWEGRAQVYVGPKEYDRLKAIGLEGAINWGCFPIWCEWGGLPMQWVGVPILRVMNWLYQYVRNYGLAIILLTVIIRVLFYPLTVKSMRSMKAMQVLQPQVNALRNKYRSDPRKLQEETMALYRKHKVNPMGGCLPMVAQIPVFYALYVVLTVSAELQSAPFICIGRVFGVDLWICDLASVDPTYVLPVLMAVTMFIQQKLAPTPADPQQARMMMLMPIMFGGMFIIFPIASGLVLYWTVSNILQILQQWWMDRGTRAAAPAPAKAAKGGSKG